MIFRAGWPDVGHARRAGKWWVWIGPYIVGWGWDDED